MPALAKFQAAVEAAKQTLSANQRDPTLLRRLADATAILAFESGFHTDTRSQHDVLYDEAIAIYRKALELSPDSGVLLNNLGVALSNRGCHSAAVESLRIAVGLIPNDRNAHFNLAVALMNVDEAGRREAPEHFRAATELQPGSETLEAYFDPHGY